MRELAPPQRGGRRGALLPLPVSSGVDGWFVGLLVVGARVTEGGVLGYGEGDVVGCA